MSTMKKIGIILGGVILIVGIFLLIGFLHNTSAKENYNAAKNYLSTNIFNVDSAKKYVGDLDAPHCIFCLDGFHKSDSVQSIVADLKEQDSICQIFELVNEKLNTSLVDFSDIQHTKKYIDSLPLIKSGKFMFDSTFATQYTKINNLCVVGSFMQSVSAYLQEDEWNYHILTGHLQQLISLDFVQSEEYLDGKYKNFKNRYDQLANDRKLRGRLNKGDFWGLVALYNEGNIENCLFSDKYALLKDFIRDEKLFNGFYATNQKSIAQMPFSQIKNLWEEYVDIHQPQPVVEEEKSDFEIVMEESKVEEKPKETESKPKESTTKPVAKTTTEVSTPPTKTTVAKTSATKASVEKTNKKKEKTSAADNRSYSDMMYGDDANIDKSKIYNSEDEIFMDISTRSALYKLNKNQITSTSSKAKVQQLKNLLDGVTESQYSRCYNSTSTLNSLIDALTREQTR